MTSVLLLHERQDQLTDVGFAEAAAAGGVAAGPGQAGVQIDEIMMTLTPLDLFFVCQFR